MKPLLFFYFLVFSLCVTAQTDSIQTGKASYYAKKFEGRKTANGEKFSNLNMTAAHKTLPFGTKVKVTNSRNDKSVIVTINDRLPKQSKRTIDLSQCAAKELDFIKDGITKVSIQIVPDSIKAE